MDLAIAQSMMKNNYSMPNYYNTQQQQQQSSRISQSPALLKQTTVRKNSFSEDAMLNEDHTHSDEAKKNSLLINLLKAANEKLNTVVNNETIRKPHQVTVRVFLIFLKIGEIDNVKERYQADAYIESCWEDNDLHLNATGDFDPALNWDPELFIENSVGNLKQEIRYRVEKKNGKTKIIEMRNVKGCFWERLELWDFPGLSITVTSAKSHNEVKFEPSLESECAINTQDFRQQQEWNLYPHLEISKKYKNDLWKNYTRPCYTVSSTVSRKPGYFIYNAYMLIFTISTLGFTPFSFAYSAPHFRIQTTCLFILSSVNFRWIVTQKLPTVSYLTTLDKYAISALIFLVLLCLWHAVIGSKIFNAYSGEQRVKIDWYVLIGIASLYALFHLCYILMFLIKYHRYKNIGPSNEATVSGKKKKDDDFSLNKSDYFNEKFNQSHEHEELQQKQMELTKSILKSSDRSSRNNSNKQSDFNTQLSNSSSTEIKYRNLMDSPPPFSSSADCSSTTNIMKYNVKILDATNSQQQPFLFGSASQPSQQQAKQWRH